MNQKLSTKQKQNISLQAKLLVGGGLSILVVLILITFFNTANVEQAYGDNTGNNSPSASTNSSSGNSWSNTSNAFSSNNSDASVSMGNGVNSKYLTLTDFGFSLPSNAVISGITVSIEKAASSTNRIKDYGIYLTKDGSSTTGSDYTNSSYWGTSDATTTYGGTSDLWGTTFTYDEINASTFGVMIRARNYGSGNRTAYIDHVQINVEYTLYTAPSEGPGGVVSNMELWLKADAGVTESSLNVSQWDDNSGYNRNATSSGSARPDYEAVSINFNPAIDFNGTAEYFDITEGGYTQDFYMMVVPNSVINYASSSAIPYSVDAVNPSGLGTASFGFGSCTGGLTNEVIHFGSGSSAEWRRGETSTTKSYAAGKPFLVSINNDDDASSTEIYVNGEQVDNTTGSGGYIDAENNRACRIGGNHYAVGGSYFNGKIAEFITYSSVNSAEDRAKIVSYMAMKYGMTIDANYYLGDGTEIWNATSDATYHNRVTFIGRDDDSGLEQKQSASIETDNIITIAHGSTVEASNAANSTGFAADQSYLIFGDNNDVLTGYLNTDIGTTADAEVITGRIKRTWRVKRGGNVGSCHVVVDMSTFPGVIEYGPGYEYSSIRLLTDADGVFASGATGFAPVSIDSDNSIVEFDVTFNDGTTYFSLGTLDESGAAPLPVELTKFDAKAQDKHVNLLWETASERDNARFEVQRSTDAQSWETIEVVDGAGNSDVAITYAAIDKNPINGKSYYRLMQMDFDGEFEYSSIRSVVFGSGEIENMAIKIESVFPNPFDDNFNISIESPVNQAITINITTLTGNVLKSQKETVIQGTNQVNVYDLGGLTPGNYLLTVSTPSERKTIKLVKR